MEAIERIEIHVRSRWTNRFTLEYGAHGYMNPAYFNCPWKHHTMLTKLVSRVEKSNEVFHSHYKATYEEPFLPPQWAVCQTMSFTELSTWYSATLNNKIKDQVALDLGLPNKELMTGTLEALSYIRNICAHHGRLWNRGLVKRAPKIKRFRSDMLLTPEKPTDGQAQEAVNSVYNALVVILHMLAKQSVTTTFPSRLFDHIKTATKKQRKLMGFPEDWQTRPIWSKITA